MCNAEGASKRMLQGRLGRVGRGVVRRAPPLGTPSCAHKMLSLIRLGLRSPSESRRTRHTGVAGSGVESAEGAVKEEETEGRTGGRAREREREEGDVAR